MLDKVKAQIEELRRAFGRLTQREQLMVVGGGAAVVLFVLIIVMLAVGNAISTAERRVRIKTDKLTQVLELQGEYRARKRQQQRKLRELRRTNVRLISVVENAARQAGVNIDRLNPEEDEPNAEGIAEARVDLRASELSIDKLQDFLTRLEKSDGVIILQRMRIQKPYRKDTLDLELTVSTYKVES